MIKTKKIIVAVSFIMLGLIIFASAMTAYGWDFTKLSTSKYETNTHEINEAFDSISIDSNTADILFLTTTEEKSKIVCYEKEKINHSVKVENGTLSISVEKGKWYNRISLLDFKTPKITVYLSDSEYKALTVKGSTGEVNVSADFRFQNVDIQTSTGDIDMYASVTETAKIKVSTGDIKISNTSVGALNLSASTGDITVSNSVCEGELNLSVTTGEVKLSDVKTARLTSAGSTGDIDLKNVLVSGKLTIERSTGDVEFKKCDAGEIFIKTDTGDVFGSLLSEKIFIPRSDTGDIDVPKTTTGGICEITTDTGDIVLTIEK